MTTVTVAEIAEYLGTPLVGPRGRGGVAVRDLVDDSRTLRAGDGYVAMP